jgi:hypothetical protein
MATTGVDTTKLRRRYRIAYWVLYVVGGLTLLLGLAAVLSMLTSARGGLGNGWVTIAQGTVVLVLGYFTMRGSLAALGIAIGWYTVESLLTIAVVGIAAVPIRAVVIFFLVQGFLALRVVNQQERLAASSSAPSSDPPPPSETTPNN